MWITESLIVRGSLFVLASTAAAAGPSSCSSDEKKDPAAMEAVELLDLLAAQNKRHDPHNYVEVDLGKFKVTHVLAKDEGYMLIQFHLFGVLPQGQQAEFAAELPLFEKRVRDAVISLVQHSDIEQLADPKMEYLKSELVIAINRVLQGQVIKDVAFSEFSLGPG